MKNKKYWPSNNNPVWLEEGFRINESVFCETFISTHKIVFCNGFFFTEDGRVTDEMPLRSTIYAELKDYASNNVARKVGSILDLLKLSAQVEDFRPVTNCIHLANGTLNLNGSFQEGKPEVVRNRLPVRYNPKAAQPTHWLRFLSDLLYSEDIPTVQEFIGYCLIPSNKGQRDDMRMEALRQTNYVKSIVTAQGQMDLERKGKQSYQGWMYARLLAFSNGDLQALYDRSDGFYRRQLVLTTRDKPADRVDDPDIAEKMAAEAEGIFLWAFEGLQRLVRNGFKFTESDRARQNRELVKRDNNNFFDFMEAEDYIRLKADACISSKDLYTIYKMWCEENNLVALKARSFSDAVIANLKKYNLEHTNNVANSAGRRVWGYLGIEALVRPEMPASHWG